MRAKQPSEKLRAKGGIDLTTLSHESAPHERPSLTEIIRVREMWAGIAIVSMWLAVLLDGIYGSDFVTSTPGGTTTTIPSAFLIAFFAFLGTASCAKYGFRRDGD
jgi:hypothetical protein